MKTIIFILVINFCITVEAQTYVKTADKAEYAKYVTWCNTPVPQQIEQFGKYTVLKVNGQYADSTGIYYAKQPVTVAWFKPGINPITIEPDERLVIMQMTVTIRRRTPTIADFYANWKTHKIP